MRFSQSPAVVLTLAAVSSVAAYSHVPRAANNSKPLVEPNALRSRIKFNSLLDGAIDLEEIASSTEGNNRAFGTPGHEKTISYITRVLDQFSSYYKYYVQEFKVPLGKSAHLTLDGKRVKAFPVHLAPAGIISAPVIVASADACHSGDFPDYTNETIVLVSYGGCESHVKVKHAHDKGAHGVIIYNTRDFLGPFENHSLGLIEEWGGPYLPTVALSWWEGTSLRDDVHYGHQIVATIKSETNDVITKNIIAETIEGDHDNVIQLSAISDSVNGQGLNENGSGLISILEIAEKLTRFSVKNAVRFSWWATKAHDFLGSTYYVKTASESDLKKIRLNLHFDTLASYNYAFQVYNGIESSVDPEQRGSPVSEQAARVIQSFFKDEWNKTVTMIDFDNPSDHGTFLKAKVPTGGITSGSTQLKTQSEQVQYGGFANEPHNYGIFGDDLEEYYNLSPVGWTMITEAIAHLTATFARSFELLEAKPPGVEEPMAE
ncbi:leupeptin-inactivating enzyme 1 precursor [Diplocarpon rosae]|nr:leupeptin-inactivating enzyme 1 precursor [Diplocarpon rosae]